MRFASGNQGSGEGRRNARPHLYLLCGPHGPQEKRPCRLERRTTRKGTGEILQLETSGGTTADARTELGRLPLPLWPQSSIHSSGPVSAVSAILKFRRFCQQN